MHLYNIFPSMNDTFFFFLANKMNNTIYFFLALSLPQALQNSFGGFSSLPYSPKRKP